MVIIDYNDKVIKNDYKRAADSDAAQSAAQEVNQQENRLHIYFIIDFL